MESSIKIYNDQGSSIQLSPPTPVTPEDTPPKGQVEAAARDTITPFFVGDDVIENPNEYFLGQSEDDVSDIIAQVARMDETDPYLAGLIQLRKQSLLAMPREIVGEDNEVTDFVRQNFKGITNMHSKLDQMLEALKVGCSITEMIWHPYQNKWWLWDLMSRRQTLFCFKKKTGHQKDGNYADELRLIDNTVTSGMKLPPNKFVVTTFNQKYENRWGLSLYSNLYWYWFIKRNVINFWQIFLENFVTPIVVVKGTIADPETKAKVDDFIKNIQQRTGVRIPESLVLELIQAKQEGAETYHDAASYFDKGMCFLVLGQVSSLDSGGVGSYARDKIRDTVTRRDVLGSDVSMMESVINDCIIPPLVNYNFSNVTEYPKYRFVTGHLENMEVMLKVMDLLAKLKLPVTKKVVYEIFGLKQPEKGDDLLVIPEGSTGGLPQGFSASINHQEGIVAKYYRNLDKKSIS